MAVGDSNFLGQYDRKAATGKIKTLQLLFKQYQCLYLLHKGVSVLYVIFYECWVRSNQNNIIIDNTRNVAANKFKVLVSRVNYTDNEYQTVSKVWLKIRKIVHTRQTKIDCKYLKVWQKLTNVRNDLGVSCT